MTTSHSGNQGQVVLGDVHRKPESDGSGTTSKLSTGLFKDNSNSITVFYVETMCVCVCANSRRGIVSTPVWPSLMKLPRVGGINFSTMCVTKPLPPLILRAPSYIHVHASVLGPDSCELQATYTYMHQSWGQTLVSSKLHTRTCISLGPRLL